jgi:hypothetical protein
MNGGICFTKKIRYVEIYICRSMQTISNISCKQNNLNADKSEASANMNGRDHLEDLGVKNRMLLKCSLTKLGTKVWSGLI